MTPEERSRTVDVRLSRLKLVGFESEAMGGVLSVTEQAVCEWKTLLADLMIPLV